ncbi:MAG: EAL domain-containing protein [Christensenellaceae bacterium]|jgi:diguanylate cyclase (GGDEF)-like protein
MDNGKKNKSIEGMLMLSAIITMAVQAALFLCVFLTGGNGFSAGRLAAAIAVSAAAGILLYFLWVRRFSQTLRQLAGNMQEKAPDTKSAMGIEEIDRLPQIIKMADAPIGAFEHIKSTGEVLVTERFFSIFGLEGGEGQDRCIPYEAFSEKMRSLAQYMESQDTLHNIRMYKIHPLGGAPVWVRLQTAEHADWTLGVASDMTLKMQEKRRVECERDCDLLTNLLNRRAFHARLEEILFRPENVKTAALMRWDLDDLKFINDTYGHDFGDSYIKKAAQVLGESVGPDGGIVARASGDVFYVFLYGYASKEAARRAMESLRRKLARAELYLPDGVPFRLRASAGAAWYPEDAGRPGQLVKYADFAMYLSKNTPKANADFEIREYERDAYVAHSNRELGELIENRLVDYVFQPIVCARTGEVFGYEALMRPKTHMLNTPRDVLYMAEHSSKLYQIEKLTVFLATEHFLRFPEAVKSKKLFINSIPGLHLSSQDEREFQRFFQGNFDRLVIEIKESGDAQDELLMRKKEACMMWGCSIALDDFDGSGNSEAVMLAVGAEYVKIRRNIVRGIHKDKSKQEILRNILDNEAGRSLKVVAEGVEKEEEAEYLIDAGVDYLQGYFVGLPEKTPQAVCARRGFIVEKNEKRSSSVDAVHSPVNRAGE